MAIKSKIKGKKKKKNKPTSKKYTKYKVEGDKVTRERGCPRGGPGIFLSTGKGRAYCGRCHFTEFDKKWSSFLKIKIMNPLIRVIWTSFFWNPKSICIFRHINYLRK